MKHYEITSAEFEAIDKRMLNHEKAKDLARELTGCLDPIDEDDVISFEGKGLTINHNYYQGQWVVWYGGQVQGTSYGDDLQFIDKIAAMRKEQASRPTINRAMLEEFVESRTERSEEWYGTEKEMCREVVDQFFAWLDGK